MSFLRPWVLVSFAVVLAAAEVQVLATDPPSLQVRVTAGEARGPAGTPVAIAPTLLTLAPPEVAEGQYTGAIPRGVDPSQNLDELWVPWNAFCILPPEEPKILGLYHRGILPDSIVLTSSDGKRRFAPGDDYILNEPRGMLLGVRDRLGRQPAKADQERPECQLRATFRYFKQRLDLVQVDAGGRVSVKRGPTTIMCPPLPAPDPGHAGLAGVWVYGANGQGPVPRRAEDVAIAAADIAPITAKPPVAPVNPQALAGVIAKMRRGEPVGIGWFGDSICVGAEAPEWWAHTWSVRNTGFLGMVMRDLQQRFPASDLQPAWGILGAQSIFHTGLWEGATRWVAPLAGPWVWWEGESATGVPVTAADDLRIGDDERRGVSGRAWQELAAGDTATYAVTVAQAGTYHLFVRQLNQRARLRWAWEGGPAGEQKDHAFTDAQDLRQGLPLVWQDLGAVTLGAGAHTLRVSLADGTRTAIDAFCLSQDPRGPWRSHQPGRLRVDLVVYAMGMNGGFNEKTPRELHRSTILGHVRQMQALGTAVLLVPTMETGWRLEGKPERSKRGNRDLLVEIAAETGCALADVYTAWLDQADRGVPPEARLHNFLNHPGGEGHRLWADTILRSF